MRLPVEGTAIDNSAAHGGSMATQKLRQRVHNNVRSMLDGPKQNRCGTVLSIDERQPTIMGHSRQTFDIADFQPDCRHSAEKTARVLSSIMRAIASGWSFSAKRTVTPWLGRRCANSDMSVPV